MRTYIGSPLFGVGIQFVPIYFQNTSEQIRESTFCRPLSQIPDNSQMLSGNVFHSWWHSLVRASGQRNADLMSVLLRTQKAFE